MEWLLAQAGATAVSFATRGGYSLATHYAVKTVKKYLESVPPEDRQGLEKTRARLETKILIISPAIDLIQLISARGNTSLSTTVALTRELKQDIAEFQEDMDELMSQENDTSAVSITKVRESMELLLKRVEEAIPLIQLALTTSGACLSSDLPNNVSPARLLQAMDYVRQSEREWDARRDRERASAGVRNECLVSGLRNHDSSTPLKSTSGHIKIGPTFSITSYTTFSSSSQIAWKEDMARAQLSLFQTDKKYCYYLKLEENFNDGRYHDDKPRVSTIDVSTITRLFFSASGKLLEIEDSKSPVLVVKINEADLEADEEEEEEKVTWLAIESWSREEEEDADEYGEEEEEEEEDNSFEMSVTEDGSGNKSRVFESPVKREGVGSRDYDNPRDFLRSRDFSKYEHAAAASGHVTSLSHQLDSLSISGPSRDSISLLEYLIRLLALQSNDQKSALEITDERLNLYLRDESRASGYSGTGYDQNVPDLDSQRTMSRPIAPDTPVVLGGKHKSRDLAPAVPSSIGRGHVMHHNVGQNVHLGHYGHLTSSVSRPSSSQAPQTPLRNNQFSAFHTPNAKSAWEVDRVMRPSPLKRQ